MRGGGSPESGGPARGKLPAGRFGFLRSGPGRGAQRPPPWTPLSAGPRSPAPAPAVPPPPFRARSGPSTRGEGGCQAGVLSPAPRRPAHLPCLEWGSPRRAPRGAGCQGRGAPLPMPSLLSSHPTPSQRATCHGQSRGGAGGGGRRGQRVVPGHVPAQAPRPSRCLERGRVPAPRPAQPPRIKGRLRRGETSGRPGRGEPGSGAGEGQRSWC